ncbi:MAG: hypothetical protein IKO83_12035, partial [Oscillospiraceae bacterium]|nr:hypothetical protein [Oscillospiraceae bacterium]
GQILLHEGFNKVSGVIFHVCLSQTKECAKRYFIIYERDSKYKRQNAYLGSAHRPAGPAASNNKNECAIDFFYDRPGQ